ncbi:MAG: glycosyltransferase family 39 protein [Planctomycetota bacterium]
MTSRRALLIVLAVGSAVKLLAWLTLPLIVTNDGAYYLHWGSQLAGGRWPDLPDTRTPGYPVFVGVATLLFGSSPMGLLLAQHLLGITAAVCAWKIGRDLGGPKTALLAGLAVALEPWLLVLSHYALADAPTAVLLLAAAACVSGPNPRGPPAALAGALLGAAILMRPASMAWAPGIALVVMLSAAPNWKPRLARLAVLGLAVTITLAPWLAFNANRGVPGLARTEGLALWGGLARSGLLEPESDAIDSLPDDLQQRARRLVDSERSEDALLTLFRDIGRTDRINRGELAAAWSRDSIAADPMGYLRTTGHAALWQSNAMLRSSPYRHDETLWQMRRLGTPETGTAAPNFSTGHDLPVLETYIDTPGVGPLAWLSRNWPLGRFQWPHVPAAALTLVAIGWLAWRRRWQHAALLAGSFPIVIGHAILLQPFSRYSVSAWLLWCTGAAFAFSVCLPRAIALVRHPVLQRSEDRPERGA